MDQKLEIVVPQDDKRVHVFFNDGKIPPMYGSPSAYEMRNEPVIFSRYWQNGKQHSYCLSKPSTHKAQDGPTVGVSAKVIPDPMVSKVHVIQKERDIVGQMKPEGPPPQ